MEPKASRGAAHRAVVSLAKSGRRIMYFKILAYASSDGARRQAQQREFWRAFHRYRLRVEAEYELAMKRQQEGYR